MKTLFENWQNYLQEDSEEKTDKPKVVCNCLCIDCVFNQNKKCVDPVNEAGEQGTIDLAWTRLDDGRYICECVTYKAGEGDEPGPGTGQEGTEETYGESTTTGPGTGIPVQAGAARQYIDEK